MSLQDLIEQRDSAFAAYQEAAEPIVSEKRDATPEEDEKLVELRAEVTRLDGRIDEVAAEEKRQVELAEARKAAGINYPQPNGTTKEARTYEPGNGNSYFADFIHSSLPQLPGYEEARNRLNQHGYEQAVEVYNNSPEGRSVLRQMADNEHYRQNETRSRKLESEIRARGNAGSEAGLENRAASTSTVAGFTTPVYLTNDWAPYRQPGRVVADRVHHEDLPPYGLTVYIPHFTGASAVGVQGSENSAVTETDPTSAYLSGALSTIAGEVTVSLQLLERAQLPNMDQAIFDSLQRAYAPQIDSLVLTQMLTSPGTTTYTDSAFHLTTASGAGGFLAAVSQAKANIKTAAGTYLVPDTMVVQPDVWEFISATADGQGRVQVTQQPLQGPMNAAAAGSDSMAVEGAQGYRMQSLLVLEDNNVPTTDSGAEHQAVVFDSQETWLFEGSLTPRVLPQTLASNLSVILQVYTYATCIVRYPLSVNQITGTGLTGTYIFGGNE